MSGPRDVRMLRALLWAAVAAGCADAFEASDPGFVVSPAAEFPLSGEMTRTQVDTVAVVVVDTLDNEVVIPASVKWESGDHSIIRISRDTTDSLRAEVTAQGVGTAEITATVTPGKGVTDTVLRYSVQVHERWIAVSVGRNFTCGLNVESTAYCWDSHLQPSRVPGLFEFTAKNLEVGHMTACVVVLDKVPYCWGQNSLGEIGNGDAVRHPIPIEGAIGRAPEADLTLSAGGTFFCGTFRKGGFLNPYFIQCWGNAAFFQLGVPRPGPGIVCVFNRMDYPCRKELKLDASDLRISPFHAAALDAGENHACAIEGDTVPGPLYCWGAAATGQLGLRNDTLIPCPDRDKQDLRCGRPSRMESALRFLSVSAGWDIFIPNRPPDPGSKQAQDTTGTTWLTEGHTCAVAMDSTAYCWGKNDDGQLGAPSDSSCARVVRRQSREMARSVRCRATPQPVAVSARFGAVSAGSEHTCGITSEGLVYCWGSNAGGQLGDGNSRSRSTPARIQDTLRYSSISAGPYQTCGVTLDQGRIFCWGRWEEDMGTTIVRTPTVVKDPL